MVIYDKAPCQDLANNNRRVKLLLRPAKPMVSLKKGSGLLVRFPFRAQSGNEMRETRGRNFFF